MPEKNEPITLKIGDTEYSIMPPISLDVVLRIADAAEAFGRADEKIGSSGNRPKDGRYWRAVMDKLVSSCAIISGCLIEQDPRLTLDAIRRKMPGNPNAPEALVVIGAAYAVMLAAGVFTDEQLTTSDRVVKERAEAAAAEEAAKLGEDAPAGAKANGASQREAGAA